EEEFCAGVCWNTAASRTFCGTGCTGTSTMSAGVVEVGTAFWASTKLAGVHAGADARGSTAASTIISGTGATCVSDTSFVFVDVEEKLGVAAKFVEVEVG